MCTVSQFQNVCGKQQHATDAMNSWTFNVNVSLQYRWLRIAEVLFEGRSMSLCFYVTMKYHCGGNLQRRFFSQGSLTAAWFQSASRNIKHMSVIAWPILQYKWVDYCEFYLNGWDSSSRGCTDWYATQGDSGRCMHLYWAAGSI